MLVEPSEEYFAELAAYRNDFLENSDSMDGWRTASPVDDMRRILKIPCGIPERRLCRRAWFSQHSFCASANQQPPCRHDSGAPLPERFSAHLWRPYRLLRPPVGTQKRLCLLDAEKCAAVLQKPRPFRNSGLLPGYQRGKPQNDPEKWRPVRRAPLIVPMKTKHWSVTGSPCDF